MAATTTGSITYNWNGLSLKENEYQYNECQAVLRKIVLNDLAAYASKKHGNADCRVESQFAKAGRNVVRMLSFSNGDRWVARFRMSGQIENDGPRYTPDDDSLLKREVDCLRLIAQRTSIPVPKVFDYGYSSGHFGVPYIMMDCLPGSCAFDMDRLIPQQFKSKFYKQMANAQVQISQLTFSQIGTIAIRNDGTVHIGPIPGIGGPFTTATDYLRAWAHAAKFPTTEDVIRRSCGPFADEIWQSTVDFPQRLSQLADRICNDTLNQGPFPLFHPDFGHQNMVVDPSYNVLGVIDWEHATTMPWEAITFPYTLGITPPPMCPPQWYDTDGMPVDDDLKAQHHDLETYISAVKEAESELEAGSQLSSILSNKTLQNVAAGMDLYVHHGKMGFYSRVLEPFQG